MTRAKKVLLAAAVLAAVAVPADWWLLHESGTPRVSFALDLQELRALADRVPGQKPRELRVEHVAGFEYPATAIVAGDGWAMRKMPVFAYQLLFDHGMSGLIDTAMDEKTTRSQSGTFFDAEAFTRVQDAITRAQWVVVTHEHFDHLGGAAAHPKLDALAGAVVRLTKEQLSDPRKREPLTLTPQQLEKLPTLAAERVVALAPGVVLLRAPGHTPGMQMVYVRRADGEEYLFVSDVAWHQQNWMQVRERARLVTWLFLGEDRDAVLAQLAAIKALAEQEPKLHVVPGHDGAVMEQLLAAGLLTPRFQ